MRRKKNKVVLIATILTLIVCAAAQAATDWAVDEKGNITKDGNIFNVQGGAWFGLEGRAEENGDSPMEQYIGNVSWASTNRTIESDAAYIKSLGFNSIRLPLVPQTFDDNNPQGSGAVLKNTEKIPAYTALKRVIKACAANNLYVLLDMHSCSNYVGWRKGRLDARPPWTDGTRENYNFKRDNCSCSSTRNPSGVTIINDYNETKWLEDLKKLAGLGKELSVDNIMGIDIYNEPWDYSWDEWKTLIEHAYQAINAVNPNILIFAQGVGGSNGNQDGIPDNTKKTPFGKYNVNWGENLYEAGTNPPNIPKNKLVYSPHCYGPSVCPQPMFADPSQTDKGCDTLVEDAFGNAKCQIKIDPAKLEPGWHEHFGYLRALGYAICIGEFGGNMDWPNKSDQRIQNRYNYLTDKTTDRQWQEAFVDYLIKEGARNGFYWSINPESADTYGLISTPYDPLSNKSGWGTWGEVDTRKQQLLNRLWSAKDPEHPGTAPVINGVHTALKNGVTCNITTTGLITYKLPKAERVSLSLYNVNGRLISEIKAQQKNAGTYSISQRQLASTAGSYVLVFKAGEFSHKQMINLAK